jgi:hypothetical protein
VSEPTLPTSPLTRAEKIAKVNAWRKSCVENVIGVVMPDGTIFAGTLPDGHKLYVMPRNESISMTFNDAAAHIGKVNKNQRLTHSDWRLPTKEELALLWKNHDKGALKGTFECSDWVHEQTDGDYWSSTPTPHSTASLPVVHVQNFDDGSTGRNSTGCSGVVRLVR